MIADLAQQDWRLGATIASAFEPNPGAGTAWMGIGILLLISTNICEINVLDIRDPSNAEWKLGSTILGDKDGTTDGEKDENARLF